MLIWHYGVRARSLLIDLGELLSLDHLLLKQLHLPLLLQEDLLLETDGHRVGHRRSLWKPLLCEKFYWVIWLIGLQTLVVEVEQLLRDEDVPIEHLHEEALELVDVLQSHAAD